MIAVVLGGGQWQAPLINYLKGLKYCVYVVNPYKTDTTKLGNFFIQEDIRHTERIVHALKGLQPSIVTSDQSDVAVMPVAKLSAVLGTRRNDLASVTLFTNKLAMADFATTNKIPVPAYAEAVNIYAIEDFASKNGLPVILKPIDANASRGFVKLESLENLIEKLAYSRSFSLSNRVMVQKHIDGDMVILDGFCSGCKHRTLAHASKKHFREGVASEVRYPSTLNKELLAEMEKANDKFVEESGLEFGATHAEYMVVGKHFWLLEIAARGGGFKISSDIVPWVSSTNMHGMLLENLVGRTVQVKRLKITSKPALLKFFEFPSGKVTKIRDDVRLIPYLKDHKVEVSLGDVINPARDGGSRHAWAIICALEEKEIARSEALLDKSLKVEVK